jgi:ABC-type dipeptide/oligopeptide/nickel transport system permease subunit
MTTGITPSTPLAQLPVHYAGFWAGAWRRFRRNFLAMYGIIFVSLIVIMAVFAPILAPYDQLDVDIQNTLSPPSAQHLMGTDAVGRDLFSRIMFATRPMLMVGVITQAIAMLIGVPLGIIAGYAGGVFNYIVQRLVDFFSALPWYLLVLFLIMILTPSLTNLIIALSITSWVGPCRVSRGLTLSVREMDYAEAARALGIPTWRILINHILPQTAPLLLWSFATGIPTLVFAEAGLSFLGLGVRPPDPSLGQMLGTAGQFWQFYPHMFLFPSLMIILSILAFQGLADGLRTAIDVNVNI